MKSINSSIPTILDSARTIAVVGISDNPTRASWRVAKDLQAHGYVVIPVNPGLSVWDGMTCYPDLPSVPVTIDVVDIFRRPEYVDAIVDDAIAVSAKVVWMQSGIINDAAAKKALESGLDVVMDRCMSIEMALHSM